MGIPEYEAKRYEGRVKDGGTLLSVHCDTSDEVSRAKDMDLTKRIRESVMADKALSTYAHNVKIVVVNGTVTLNGVVRSAAERNAVAMKAEAVAGKEHVVNDVKVAPPK